ncbi:MAG: KAP family NTPase [Magnetococcus sp. YQC-5]
MTNDPSVFDWAAIKLPEDKLQHDNLAKKIMSGIAYMPEGSVIALEGSWGRGKSDLLTRIMQITHQDGFEDPKIAPKAMWLDPWRYGKPDLLTPLICDLYKRVPPSPTDSNISKATWRAIGSLAGAGVNILLKTAPSFIPGGNILEKIADPISKGIQGLLEAKGDEQDAQHAQYKPFAEQYKLGLNDDPTLHFQHIVQTILTHDSPGKRLLICIDDLDRCLPNQQVALLEALHFLTAVPNVPVIFLVALDPTLAEQAVRTHYNVEHFDPRLYLDKIFSIRFGLPSLSETSVSDLVKGWYSRKEAVLTNKLNTFFDLNNTRMAEIVGRGLTVPILRNPRVVERILDRLAMLALLHPGWNPENISQEDLYLLVRWIGIGEKWRGIRLVLQAAPKTNKYLRMQAISKYYIEKSDPENEHEILRSLPEPKTVPELVMILAESQDFHSIFTIIDEFLLEAGL